MNIDWNSIPDSMGIYMWKSLDGKIIYISKAKNIRESMKLYFFSSNKQMEIKYINNIQGFEYIKCQTFNELILLEEELIDFHRPKFNLKIISMKKYPYIEMRFKDKINFKISKTSKEKKMTKYYGPFSDIIIARKIIDILVNSLDIVTFNESLFNLEYNEFNRKILVDKIFNFLRGDIDTIESIIRNRIILNNKKGNYIESSKYDKYLEFITSQKKGTNKIFKWKDSKDIINFFIKDGVISISIMHIRYGNILGTSNFISKKFNPEIKEFLDSFIRRYYKYRIVPDEIISPIHLNWEEYQFKNLKFDFEDEITLDLLAIVKKHARIKFSTNIDSPVQKIKGYDKALKFLKENFEEKEIHNVEMIDFFPLNLKEKIAIVVRFNMGVPAREEYKKYISNAQDINQNLSYIKELIYMHFEKKIGKNMPDIFIVKDKVQLQITKKVLYDQKINGIIIIALDSWNQNVGTLINSEGKEFKFKKDTHIHSFLNKMQDESHKFIIHFHKNRNKDGILENQLDKYVYLSDYNKQQLFKKFKTRSKILHASIDDLKNILGKEKAEKFTKDNNE